MEKFTKFARIAETEFSDIIISTHDLGHKLRLYLYDKSFIDFFYSAKTKIARYAIHWERSHIDSSIYLVDNTSDPKWKHVATFPVHFHSDRYENVIAPPFIISKNLEQTFRRFLLFVKTTKQSPKD